MDKFEQDELTGRSWFEGFVKQLKVDTTWQPTTGKYDFVDGYVVQDNKKVVVEIKTRSPAYVKFSSHWIELDKYMNLTKAKIDGNCMAAWYVNFFGADTMYIYNLKYVDTTTCPLIKKWVPKTTAANNGYEYKQFLDIPTKYAIRFERVNNKWTRIN